MINALSLFLLLSSLATIVLGIWVWRINPKSIVYLRWFLFCACIAIWSLGLGVLTTVRDQKVADTFYLIHYFGAIPIPITFLHFIRSYFLKETRFTLDLTIGYLLVIIQYLLFLTGQLVAPLTPKWEFTYYTNPGPYYFLFVIYFFAYVFYCFYLMFKATLAEKQSERKKRIFFIVATGLGYLFGSTTFLLVYDFPIPPYGIYIFLLFPIITTYAIVRHHLMDIEVLIRRTVVFTGLFVFVFFIIATINFVLQILLVRVINVSNSVSLGIGIAILLLLYEPIKQFLINLTDRFLFQKKYDYRAILKKIIPQLHGELRLEQLLEQMVNILVENIKLENCAIFLVHESTRHYRLQYQRGLKTEKRILDRDAQLVKELIVRQDILARNQANTGLDGKRLAETLVKEMAEFESYLCIPLILQNDLKGIISLGKKKSDVRQNVSLLLAPKDVRKKLRPSRRLVCLRQRLRNSLEKSAWLSLLSDRFRQRCLALFSSSSSPPCLPAGRAEDPVSSFSLGANVASENILSLSLTPCQKSFLTVS